MIGWSFDCDRVIDATVAWARTQFAPTQGAVLGVSGGVDSAVTAHLLHKAGVPTLALLKPNRTNATVDVEYAVADLEALGFRRIENPAAFDWAAYRAAPYHACLVVPVAGVLDQLARACGLDPAALPDLFRFPQQNAAPRVRMVLDYYFANALGWKVVGTDHWTEAYVGFFTKYGDGGFDLSLLSRRVKLEIWAMARALGVYPPIIDREPTAGLWEGQTDEGEFRDFTYLELSRFLRLGTSGNPAADAAIAARHKATEHKRQLPVESPV